MSVGEVHRQVIDGLGCVYLLVTAVARVRYPDDEMEAVAGAALIRTKHHRVRSGLTELALRTYTEIYTYIYIYINTHTHTLTHAHTQHHTTSSIRNKNRTRSIVIEDE